MKRGWQDLKRGSYRPFPSAKRKVTDLEEFALAITITITITITIRGRGLLRVRSGITHMRSATSNVSTGTLCSEKLSHYAQA